MGSIQDFFKWAGSQRKAAELLGVSEATISRMATGKQPISPSIAERVERITDGLFRRERVLWPASGPAPSQSEAA